MVIVCNSGICTVVYEKKEWMWICSVSGLVTRLLCWCLQAIYSMVGTAITDNNPDDTPETRTTEIFLKMDENKDGVLEKDEFIKGCMSDQFLYQMLTADPSGGIVDE